MSEPEEYILYRSAREITSLPDAEIGPAIYERLTKEAVGTVDLERTMGLGQIARIKRVPDVERWLVRWLETEKTATRYDAVALFLWGYWSAAEPSADAIAALLSGLEAFAANPSARDSLVSALACAFSITRSDDIKRRIHAGFAVLSAQQRQIQPAVQERLDKVLSND